MIFRQLSEPVSNTYTYLLGCEASGQAILIDPVVNAIDRDLQVLQALGLTQSRWPQMRMPNLATNQDACKGAAFRLTFTGAAVQFTGAAVQAPDLAPNVTAAGAGGCAPALRAPWIAGCEDARR